MVTEKKGCGLVHAVNGGFSWACGHCARANETLQLRVPDSVIEEIRDGRDRLRARVDLSQYGNGLRLDTEAQKDREVMNRQIHHDAGQAWVETQLGDVPFDRIVEQNCHDNPMRWAGVLVGADYRPPDGEVDPATVGDVGEWPPLHVVEQGPLDGGWALKSEEIFR